MQGEIWVDPWHEVCNSGGEQRGLDREAITHLQSNEHIPLKRLTHDVKVAGTLPWRYQMRKSLTIALVAASALLAACSDSDNGNNRATGPAALDAGDINVDLTRDVRDNLASHFSVTAAKLPNRAADLRYDFHETSRTMAGNEGIVTGDFIFFAEGDPVEKGSLAIFYTAGQTAWFRSGLFEVSDQVAQDVHEFTVAVRDASTLRPIVGAEVEARRIEGRSTARIFTNSDGQATVQVLPGVFQIEVSRDFYTATMTDNITTVGASNQLFDIALVRIKDPVRSL